MTKMTKQSLTCEEVVERLFPYLDKELDDETSAEVDRHLEACRGCYTRAEFEKRLKAKIAETGQTEAPESLRRRVKDLIDRF
jgi:mycothiol system anti-sigma-R factor